MGQDGRPDRPDRPDGPGRPGRPGPPRPECDPPEEVKAEIEAAVREIIGDKTDVIIDILKNDEDASIKDAVKAADLTRQQTRQVRRTIGRILREGWECPEEEEGKCLRIFVV